MRMHDRRTRADIEQILKEVVEVLVREYQPETIILYGSYAYGSPTRHSDIDLFIVKETDKDRFERNVEVRGLVFKPGRGISVQPIVLTPAEVHTRLAIEDQFIQEILEKGEILVGRRTERKLPAMV